MHKIIPEIILASQSLPRKQLLERLQLKFTVLPADIDESPITGETPYELVERLSRAKAEVVAQRVQYHSHDHCIIIASDQIAIIDNQVYGKPGNFTNAYNQLKDFSGKTIEFVTGLCVINQHNNSPAEIFYQYESSKIKLKTLTESQIKNYLLKDLPYQAAASLKIESLGISLVESISTADYNAIIGLPLIKLVNILQQINLDILDI